MQSCFNIYPATGFRLHYLVYRNKIIKVVKWISFKSLFHLNTHSNAFDVKLSFNPSKLILNIRVIHIEQLFNGWLRLLHIIVELVFILGHIMKPLVLSHHTTYTPSMFKRLI